MFGFLKGKSKKMVLHDYREAVNNILEKDGFDPLWLNSLLPDNPVKLDRLYHMLQTKGLEPEKGAKAIEVGTHLFNRKKEEAAGEDWPLKYTDKVPSEYRREECFFLEQVTEAVTTILGKNKKSSSSCLGLGKC